MKIAGEAVFSLSALHLHRSIADKTESYDRRPSPPVPINAHFRR
jgi:hypothetical protein